VREELNQRMENGEPGKSLVAWLNGLPEVKQVLAAHFEGRDINEVNLSEWRNGGYLDAVAHQEALEEARERAADADELAFASDDRPAHNLATILTFRYAEAVKQWDGEVTEEFERKLRVLGALCNQIARLRRGEQNGERVRLATEEGCREETDWLENREKERKIEKWSEEYWEDCARRHAAEAQERIAKREAGGKGEVEKEGSEE